LTNLHKGGIVKMSCRRGFNPEEVFFLYNLLRRECQVSVLWWYRTAYPLVKFRENSLRKPQRWDFFCGKI